VKKKILNKVNFNFGNILEMEYPKSDVFVISYLNHNILEKNREVLFKKINNSLNKGGYLIIADYMVDNERKLESMPATANTYHLLMGYHGDYQTEEEIINYLLNHGYKLFNSFFTINSPGLIICQKT